MVLFIFLIPLKVNSEKVGKFLIETLRFLYLNLILLLYWLNKSQLCYLQNQSIGGRSKKKGIQAVNK